MEEKVWGIDYGSKMAGTTVVAYLEKNELKWLASEKKKDADRMIIDAVASQKPDLIAIDAPLSLPGVYTGIPDFNDHFYRVSDRETKAMSPMFLGGLTARAMKLKAQLPAVQFIEAYPVKTGKELGLQDLGFRTKEADQEQILNAISKLTGWSIDSANSAVSGHHIDATLALLIAQRYLQNTANRMGHPEEGLIYY